MRVLAFILVLFLTSCATRSDTTLESLLRSVKDEVQQSTLLRNALQDFYVDQRRWPTNAADFWAATPREGHRPDETKFKRLEFTPKGDGSTFVEYDLALEHPHSGCFNIKPDEKQ